MISNYSQTIPMFNGETGDTDLGTEWLNALKAATILNGWTGMSSLEAARSHLKGAAKHWYLSRMAELNTFEKFNTAFESMFTCKENITKSWKKMNERVQRNDETVFTYFHEKVRLCRRLGLHPEETKKCFVSDYALKKCVLHY